MAINLRLLVDSIKGININFVDDNFSTGKKVCRNLLDFSQRIAFDTDKIELFYEERSVVLHDLKFRTDRSQQTAQTQIRQLLDQGHSIYIVWIYYSMVKPHFSNFSIIMSAPLMVGRHNVFAWVVFCLSVRHKIVSALENH